MTTEDEFQAKLNSDPTDWQTRVVFADWLDEQGDPRAAGYRALGMLRKHPRRFRAVNWVGLTGAGKRNGYYWARLAISATVEELNFDHLGDDWYALLEDHAPGGVESKGYDTRFGAEEAAVTAFLKLPQQLTSPSPASPVPPAASEAPASSPPAAPRP